MAKISEYLSHMDYPNSQQEENGQYDEIPRRDDDHHYNETRDNILEATEDAEPHLTNFLQIRTLTPKASTIQTNRISRLRRILRRGRSPKRSPSDYVNIRQNWRDDNNEVLDSYYRGEIARILIPQDGFDSARHLTQVSLKRPLRTFLELNILFRSKMLLVVFSLRRITSIIRAEFIWKVLL